MNHKNEKYQKKNKFSIALISILSPFLLALFAVLFEYSARALIFTPPHVILILIFVLWAVILIIIFPIQRLTKNWVQTGTFLFAIVIIVGIPPITLYVTLIVLIGAHLVLLFASHILKKKLQIETIAKSLFILTGSAILVIVFFRLLPAFLLVDWETYENALPEATPASNISIKLPENPPDIYIVILDGYGDIDVLRDFYGFDNTEMITSLEQKGFIIPSKMYANYSKTSASIPTTLNMDYIHTLVEGANESVFWWLTDPYTKRNQVSLLLEQAGYQSIAIATDWDGTHIQNADLHFSPYQYHLTQFEGNYLYQTPLKTIVPLFNKAVFIPSNKSHYELIRYNFEQLGKIPGIPGPKFVFAHITAPHPPFVIGNDGDYEDLPYSFTFNDASNYPGSFEEYRNGYINKVKFVNDALDKTIDEILSKSTNPPIIIILADHGPGMMTDFTSAENTCLQERFSIFAAFYLPGLDETTLPQDMTPVNLFRIILNEYFSTNLPLLENHSYYHAKYLLIYQVEDITQQIMENKENCVTDP